MKGYPYEVRCYRLQHDRQGWREMPEAVVVDRGTIDRATPEMRDVLMRMLARLADPKTNSELCRYRVRWQRSPRGRYARLFCNLHQDCVI